MHHLKTYYLIIDFLRDRLDNLVSPHYPCAHLSQKIQENIEYCTRRNGKSVYSFKICYRYQYTHLHTKLLKDAASYPYIGYQRNSHPDNETELITFLFCKRNKDRIGTLKHKDRPLTGGLRRNSNAVRCQGRPTFSACRPLGPVLTSNSTSVPSSRDL